MKQGEDRRVARTKAALLEAFTRLFFKGGYESFNVADVAREANVGRSTLYEHFDGKEDVLWASMSHFFSVFAEAVVSPAPPATLQGVMAHLWENRKRADAVFTGAPRAIISRSLAQLIEVRLHKMGARKRPLIAPRLAAMQIAEAQLVLVDSWLRGRAAATPAAMADALYASSAAMARALMTGRAA